MEQQQKHGPLDSFKDTTSFHTCNKLNACWLRAGKSGLPSHLLLSVMSRFTLPAQLELCFELELFFLILSIKLHNIINTPPIKNDLFPAILQNSSRSTTGFLITMDPPMKIVPNKCSISSSLNKVAVFRKLNFIFVTFLLLLI